MGHFEHLGLNPIKKSGAEWMDLFWDRTGVTVGRNRAYDESFTSPDMVNTSQG